MCYITQASLYLYCTKNVDIKFSAHHMFQK